MRELGCNWELGFLRVFLCTIVFSLIIVKSLQFRGRKQIAEPRKYYLVRVIVFFGMCFLYLFCFSQVGIVVKFPTRSNSWESTTSLEVEEEKRVRPTTKQITSNQSRRFLRIQIIPNRPMLILLVIAIENSGQRAHVINLCSISFFV